MEPQDQNQPAHAAEAPPLYYGIKHLGCGRVYDYPAPPETLPLGKLCILESPRGPLPGQIVAGPYTVKKPFLAECGHRFLRLAAEPDLQSFERTRVRERDAFKICRRKIEQLKLPMHLSKCELSQGGGRATFYFSAEGRVDFRELIRLMAQELHCRIEMVQIGVRDETKCVGGMGICGREFCCSSHLRDFAPVSIKMAKEQNLALNPQKVSGGCGRLLCCLGYEYGTYRFLNEGMPKVGKRVTTARGLGRVKYIDVFRQLVIVQYEDGSQEAHAKDQVARYQQPPIPPRPGGETNKDKPS